VRCWVCICLRPDSRRFGDRNEAFASGATPMAHCELCPACQVAHMCRCGRVYSRPGGLRFGLVIAVLVVEGMIGRQSTIAGPDGQLMDWSHRYQGAPWPG
jgi:hypothetical protein